MKFLSLLLVALLGAGAVPAPASAAATPIQIYGAWHCSDDACIWGTVRTVAEFDSQNHWLIDRGDGRPSVNLVVLSFVHPLKLLQQTNDATTVNGVPRGMTPEIVNYFTSRGIRVMLSIGGITYTDAWNQALSISGTQLGQRAAALATQLNVGIEIDYEENTNPNLAALQDFITAYRAVHPFDASGSNPRAPPDHRRGSRGQVAHRPQPQGHGRLAAHGQSRARLRQRVPARQPSVSSAQANWQEHVDGKPQYSPPVPPLAPAKFTGAFYIAEGRKVRPECTDFADSLQKATAPYVQSVAPNGAGTSAGMLGFMFWAAERPSTRGVGTMPPNTCEGGMGVAATTFGIPIPMPPLRQS